MKKNNFTPLFLFALLLTMPLLTACVTYTSSSGTATTTSIGKILTYPVPINLAKVYGPAYKASNTVPFWILLASFTIAFAIIWLSTNYVKILKDQRGPRMAIAIAVSAIAILATPLAFWIMKLIDTFTLLSVIAILILGIYTIWTMTHDQWARNAKINADASSSLAATGQQNAETQRQKAQTREYKNKTAKAASEGLHHQLNEIRKLKPISERVMRNLQRIRTRNAYPVNKNSISMLLRDVSTLRTDIGKFITFATENDRLLSTMSDAHYDYTAGTASGITGLNAGKAKINDINKETDDLGSTIAAMAETLQNNGIPDKDANNHLLSWAEVVINILNRMERDIVLEEQMIEKI